MSNPSNECRELELSIMAFFDGELPRADEDAVLAHLEACEACREELGAQQMLRDELAGVAAHDALPLALRDRISAALAQESRVDELAARRRRVNQWLIPGGATMLAAAALLLAVLGTRPLGAPNSMTGSVAGALVETPVVANAVAAEAARQLVRAAPLEVQGAAATPAWVQRYFDAGIMLPALANAPARAYPYAGGADPSTSPAIEPLRNSKNPAVRLLGARLSTFRGRDAILLQYEVERPGGGTLPMHVLAFSAHDLSWGRVTKIRQGGRDLYLDEHLGVRAVATVDHGYAYVFASSAMSHEDLAHLVTGMNWCKNGSGDEPTRC